MTQGEVVPRLKDGRPNPDFPHDGLCKTGHIAPPGTRFFQVSGKVVPKNVVGVYCEHCLAVANRMSRLAKEGKGDTLDPQKELLERVQQSGGGSNDRN
jgi:hypothetical protein